MKDGYNFDKSLFKTNTDMYSGLDTDYLPAGTNIGSPDEDAEEGSTREEKKEGAKEGKEGNNKEENAEEEKKKQKKEKKEKEKNNNKEEKPRKRKKRRKKHYFLRLLVIIAVFFIVRAIVYSSLFAISEIHIKGNTLITDEEVISLVGIKEGDNIFEHTTSSVMDALSFDPYISGVVIDRNYPDIITINIIERLPVIALQYGDQFLILDNEGKVIAQESDQKSATLLFGLEMTSFEINKVPEFTDQELFEETLSFVNEVNKSGLFFKKLETSALMQKGYVTDTLIVQGNREFILKNLDNIKAVLYDIGQKGIERGVISVNAYDYATFSPVLE